MPKLRMFFLYLDGDPEGEINDGQATYWLLYAWAPLDAFAIAEEHLRRVAEDESRDYEVMTWQLDLVPECDTPGMLHWHADDDDPQGLREITTLTR